MQSKFALRKRFKEIRTSRRKFHIVWEESPPRSNVVGKTLLVLFKMSAQVSTNSLEPPL